MALLYNLIGAIVALISMVMVIIYDVNIGAITYISISYLIWGSAWFFNILTKPKNTDSFCMYLQPLEIDTFRRMHLFVLSPVKAQMVSGGLNSLRFAGIIWAMMCVYLGQYWLVLSLLIFYALSGSLIACTAPNLYYLNGAEKGNVFAQEQLHLLESVVRKFLDYKG